MENEEINSKKNIILKSKEKKTYQKTKKINSNKNKLHNTYSHKKIYQKTLGEISLKKDSKVKPFLSLDNENQYYLKLDTKILSSAFNYNFGNGLELPNLKNDSLLNFQKFSNFSFNLCENNKNKKKIEYFSPLLQYGSKFIINDIHSSFYYNINCIIKIQSCLRGFLVKKKFIINKIDKSYFEKNTIKSIILIQKNVRSFLERKNIRKKIIIKLINQKRQSAIDLIIKKMKIYLNIIKIKKLLFINYHLKQRKIKAIYIQETYRNYKFYKSFKKLKKEIDKNYFLYYPHKAKKVEIIIYFDDEENNNKNKKYSFTFNKLLQYFILLINPSKIFSGKYKCQYVINDIIKFDNRYPTVQYKNCFFNIIELVPRNISKIMTKPKKKIKKVKKRIENEEEKKINTENICKNIKNGTDENNLSNSSYLYYLKLSLEDIKEEEDEGKSVTSRDNRYEKIIKEISDRSLKMNNNEGSEKEKEKKYEDFVDYEDSFDFTEEEYLEIKRKYSKNFENPNYINLKNGLDEKSPINQIVNIKMTSFKKIKDKIKDNNNI